MTKEKKLEKTEAIMEAVCELCHWPHAYTDEETMYEEKCGSCPAERAVTAALEEGGERDDA